MIIGALVGPRSGLHCGKDMVIEDIMENHGFSWKCMGFDENPWISWNSMEKPWKPRIS
jgi:hypothetical protein